MKQPILKLTVAPYQLLMTAKALPAGAGVKKYIRALMLSKITLDPTKGYLVRSKPATNKMDLDCSVFERKKKNSPNRANAIMRAINTPAGMRSLANAMAAPLRHALDYQSISRKFVTVTPVANEESAKYDKDIDINKILNQKNQDPR